MDIEEAIKILKEFVKQDRKMRDYKVESDYDKFCEERCIAIETVLNELEYKQDDINVLQAQRDSVENQLKQAKAELEKKEAIINEMAKYIGEIDDETFCDEDKYERDIEDNVIGCDEDCQECVKQYFTKKVEGK